MANLQNGSTHKHDLEFNILLEYCVDTSFNNTFYSLELLNLYSIVFKVAFNLWSIALPISLEEGHFHT